MLTSVFQGCILANNHFQDQLKQDPSKQFCIINTSSVAGLELMENCPIYSLCKKAVNFIDMILFNIILILLLIGV
jgi:15-hydroxyprostaglandin dehydrogenase (NAD)